MRAILTLGAVAWVVAVLVVLTMARGEPGSAIHSTNPAAVWHLDGDATDSSANSNNGAITGATSVPGKFKQALSFDGNDFVTVAHADDLDMTGAYTISAWVNVTDSATHRPILFRAGTDANDIEVYVQSTGHLVVAHNRGNGGIFDFVRFANPPIGTLFHLAVVFDGTDVTAYFDGVAATPNQWWNTGGSNAETLGSDPGGAHLPIAAPSDTDKGWWIGKVDHNAFGGVGLRFFKGLIDEVRIWSRALSATEIAASAHMGLGGSNANQIKEKHYTSDFVVFTSHHTSASTVHISIVSDDPDTEISSASVKSTRPKKTATPCTISSQSLHNDDKSLDVVLADCTDGSATSVRLRVSLDSGDAFAVNVALP